MPLGPSRPRVNAWVNRVQAARDRATQDGRLDGCAFRPHSAARESVAAVGQRPG
jgi:hypothetical protein